jgi:general secretion pathway protein N
MKPGNTPLAIAIAAVIAAGGLLVIELYRPPPEFTTSTDGAILPAPAPVPGLPEPLIVAELEARPLFTADRRPPKPEPPPIIAAVSPPPPPPPPVPEADTALTLLGIVNGPEGRIAIIRPKTGGQIARLTEGEAVDRWQLRQISPDHVTLVIDGAVQELGFPSPTEGRSKNGAAHPPSPPPRRP